MSTPMTPDQRRESLIRRFWLNVDVSGPDDCWEWQASRTKAGYGALGSGGKSVVYTHRLSVELDRNITLASEDVIRHSCDNPPCCNPRHLSVGTQAQNMADAKARGRMLKGFCRRGHERTVENTYIYTTPKGLSRQCKDCIRDRRHLVGSAN